MKNVVVAKHPATGETIDQWLETDIQQVPDLYDKASAAFKFWSSRSLETRLSFITKMKHYLLDHMDEIVEEICSATGKVKAEALTADLTPVIDILQYYEKRAPKILKRKRVSTPLLLVGKSSYVDYFPLGTVLVISPWNFPFQLAMTPVISALIAGNSVILKPSEVTPTIGLLIEKIAREINLPKNLLQVAHGGKELGQELVAGSPDCIFFTGSVETGRKIGIEASKRFIPYTLELGGKDPMIVFEDAPLKRAVHGAIWGAFTNAGQVCMSVERVYVQSSVHGEFLDLLVEETKKLKMKEDVGSITFENQKEVIKDHVLDALEKGALLLTGKHPDQWEESMYIEPMVLTNITDEMKIVKEETFGPVMPVIGFTTEEEVIQKANSTEFGLNASVWTKDSRKANRVTSKLVTGSAVINDVLVSVANPYLPFGGVKSSGIGSYHGDEGLYTFCRQMSVMKDPGLKSKEINWYPYQNKYNKLRTLVKAYFSNNKQKAELFRSFYKQLRKK
ncbi:aldehyde dehydrogenase family protein [Fictibacillus phosphorivorans]|uniref:aldehyde dehydrogenase family protein n=1 Tax=Fictibacillus phosphorivorans TaxID=1221500 RepID=UPI00203D9821|nr:aldehyde dehydrogenase family protein [Fictibacillus phosphorivorans]MCM3717526.1 aldehyde dehydrogenase family protein [Fictibacillus phosphorivorans]MCM3775221.1 aldehyde dehydrogenase family protein [Fictibacillus phosphorivorans]